MSVAWWSVAGAFLLAGATVLPRAVLRRRSPGAFALVPFLSVSWQFAVLAWQFHLLA
jgi:hypothetical protein